MKKRKTLIGHAIPIRDNGVDLCGGVVERKSKILQDADTKNI